MNSAAIRNSTVLAVLLWLAFAPALQAQELRAYFDRTTIYEGETVILTLELDGRFPETDISALTADFIIQGNSRNYETRWVNGRASIKSTWAIQLEPKHSGEINVPPLAIGSRRTPPLQLTVLALSQDTSNQLAQDLFLEVDVKPENPYVQSQIRYAEKLFIAVPVREIQPHVVGIPDAVTDDLGDYFQYQATRNGRNYTVIERRYAIFPEKSGEFVLPVTRFEMRVGSGGSRAILNRGRRVEVKREPVVLQVRPRPDTYSGDHWLPSVELTLREEWPEQTEEFRVGEPITRKLILQAKGLSASQLPELAFPDIAQANVYPDQPLTETTIDGAWMIGRREQSIAIVPTAAGELTLPEIRLVWWDTEQDAEQVVTLPARTLTILPVTAPTAPAPVPTPAPPAPAAPGSPPLASEYATPLLPDVLPGLPLPSAAPVGLWFWLSIALLVLWLATLIAWRRERSRRATPPQDDASRATTAAAAESRRALQQACRDNDPGAAARALLAWAAVQWPQRPPQNLGALAARLDNGGEELRALDQALYAPDAGHWEGKRLWQVFKQGLVEKRDAPVSRHSGLPPLYPERA